eukprot:COSAG01_NODE_24979_length_759_cov_2.351515_1_plen_155_part_00
MSHRLDRAATASSFPLHWYQHLSWAAQANHCSRAPYDTLRAIQLLHTLSSTTSYQHATMQPVAPADQQLQFGDHAEAESCSPKQHAGELGQSTSSSAAETSWICALEAQVASLTGAMSQLTAAVAAAALALQALREGWKSASSSHLTLSRNGAS